MKKPETILSQYVKRLTVDNLKWISLRLEQRVGPDLAEALEAFSTCSDLDKWLLSAKSNSELYDIIDMVQKAIDKELAGRVPELQEA